ncbi:MAG: hypothetical protein GTN64_02310 [Candidatus Latescibacteria bacterium]|nr:hypothetical protein [Candidatus Latescibacterota bacterium]NIO77450.1 hypothetical protein [Candidatus Latescibacterota bacterium]
MQNVVTKGCLTPARGRLVELMQRINFGRIEGLEVRDGEPVIDPPPIVVRDIKFGGENGPRHELEAKDFILKREVIEFFVQLEELANGTVDVLEIKHGLPFRMSIKEAVRA